MALQLTQKGQDTFLAALQDEIRQAKLVDADGNEIEGWNYEPRQIVPAEWEGTGYPPGLNWIFVTTNPGNEAPQIVAGLAWADGAGDTLAIEPLTEPFVIQRTGQTLVVDPVLRLFGVVAPSREI